MADNEFEVNIFDINMNRLLFLVFVQGSIFGATVGAL